MKIEVRLFAYFREGRDKKLFLEFDDPVTPADIFKKININEEEVAILLINGRDGKANTELNDNDVLSLFPPVGGG
ncbi:MoaD/ThiS family protein [Clostridium ljungdahlii]|uniref:Predicted MoaD/ThiS domain protein n=1 Tax=Clostridium ljungdahlii (strain ATCC 55383 / DSM 13528 / PETC) TaxID=748727 RepID=D8GJ09_CLOLD|nr:MoaD/ThiS family protein [Clostridium ljungdahlii]ADK15084.1 predicted MoaD/ThiS domain protein [Clostridium ljungdahlii DSM 13528]OAA83798.1 ThiS family protein [Clostridium ljungdahlii DSM 13528]